MLAQLQVVHFSGPLPRRATYCFHKRSDAVESGRPVYLWREARKNAVPWTTDRGATVAKSPLHSLTPSRGF